MADLKNLSSMESTIRMEIMSLTMKRAEQEDLVQQLKNKVMQDANAMRRASAQIEQN